jgi:hypothetical protein
MKRKTAEQILEGLARMEIPWATLDDALSQIEDESEKKKITGIVGDFLLPHFRLIRAIATQFPDLDPDGAGAERYKELKAKYANPE